MHGMSLDLRTAACSVALVLAALGVASPSPSPTPVPMTPTAILAAAATLDGKPVTAIGKIQDYQVHRVFIIGTYTGFALCDAQCVTIVEHKDAGLGEGQTATISGTFHTTYTLHGTKITNMIAVGPL
jgi:hypothetical protein